MLSFGSRFFLRSTNVHARRTAFGVATRYVRENSRASAVPMSHVRGATTTPLLTERIDELFWRRVSDMGSSQSFVHSIAEGQALTWKEFGDLVKTLCAALDDLGFRKGDRIGVMLTNCMAWVAFQFACAHRGLVLVNINPAYVSAELHYAVNLVGLRMLVIDATFVDVLAPLLAGVSATMKGGCQVPSMPSLHSIVTWSGRGGPRTSPVSAAHPFVAFDDLLEKGSLLLARTSEAFGSGRRFGDEHEPYNIQFTSGTTGKPKGATLTHSNVLNNGYFVGRSLHLTPDDVVCIPVPLYHCFGCVMGILACLTHGATAVLPAFTFSPVSSLQAVSSLKCTALYGVPTMFISMLAELDAPNSDARGVDLSSLRTGIMAGAFLQAISLAGLTKRLGASCPTEIMKRVMSRMHMKGVQICYGMTETSPVSFQTSTEDPVEKRVETVGHLHPHVECKVVDERLNTVPVGVPGELCTKGYSVMKGYWNNKAQTEESFTSDGFLRTGDLCVFDSEMYLRVVGRIKDMIIRGGENIYPREIEEVLLKMPEVRDVAVVGVSDEKYGEQVCAFIIPASQEPPSLENVQRFLREKLARFKIPKYVFPVKEFPLTVSGKIKKFELRQKAEVLVNNK